MYQLFSIIYILLLGLKLHLLATFRLVQLGQTLTDILIICGPALSLIVEFNCCNDALKNRESHRPYMQVFDMLLQALFVAKVVSGLYRGNSGRTIISFVKSRLLIGPSTYA